MTSEPSYGVPRFWRFLSLCSLMTVAMVSTRSGIPSSGLLGPRASRPPAYDRRSHRELTLTSPRAGGTPAVPAIADRFAANLNSERAATRPSGVVKMWTRERAPDCC